MYLDTMASNSKYGLLMEELSIVVDDEHAYPDYSGEQYLLNILTPPPSPDNLLENVRSCGLLAKSDGRVDTFVSVCASIDHSSSEELHSKPSMLTSSKLVADHMWSGVGATSAYIVETRENPTDYLTYNVSDRVDGDCVDPLSVFSTSEYMEPKSLSHLLQPGKTIF